MKRNKCSMVGALCLIAGGLLCTAPAFAGESDGYIGSLPQQKIDIIEQNIVNALQSDVPGMQADAAQLVRDLNSIRPEQSFSACVIPLMALLKNEDGESGVRILAALALDQLDSPKGHFAISRTASFTADAKLKYVCGWLAYERKTGKHPEEKGIASYEPLPEGEE
jgi:hypothetical protein